MIGNGPTGLVLFDGTCNLCNASIRFIYARDEHAYFRFASLDSQTAQRALERSGIREPSTPRGSQSVILIDERGVHERSDAALAIAAHLRAPWSSLARLRAIPRPIRDAVYAFVARNRYAVFGRNATCALPTGDMRSRFI